MVSKEEAERILADVKDEHHFILNNGARLKNLHELSAALADMEAGVYVHHVNRERNDFHNWIKGVHKDEFLASRIAESNGPLELRSALLQRLGELELASSMPEMPEPIAKPEPAIMHESVITNPEPIIKHPEPIALLPAPITKKPDDHKPDKIKRKRLLKKSGILKPILALKRSLSRPSLSKPSLLKPMLSKPKLSKPAAAIKNAKLQKIKPSKPTSKPIRLKQARKPKKQLRAYKPNSKPNSLSAISSFFSDFSKDISKIHSSSGQIMGELASLFSFRKKK